jgi:predicted kinase
MRDDTPTVYLLAGLPGSGKTTYAKALESEGVVRLAVDDEIRTRHGLFGDDYPAEEHLALLAGVLQDINKQLIDHVEAGRDVVLDHGLGQRDERDAYKRLVEEHGGQWCLIHFTVDHTELIRRLEIRNARPDTPSMTPAMLDWMSSVSQEPHGEGEIAPPRSADAAT